MKHTVQKLCILFSTHLEASTPKQQSYGHLPPITQTILVRQTRHSGYCWRSRGELMTDLILYTSSQICINQPVNMYSSSQCRHVMQSWRTRNAVSRTYDIMMMMVYCKTEFCMVNTLSSCKNSAILKYIDKQFVYHLFLRRYVIYNSNDSLCWEKTIFIGLQHRSKFMNDYWGSHLWEIPIKKDSPRENNNSANMKPLATSNCGMS